MTAKPKILLIYTGGTIGMAKEYNTGALKAFDFDQIENRIPELQQLNCHISTISFDEPIDSSNMNTYYYGEIAQIIYDHYNIFDGFVVLTGSDTMSYISSAISFMFENLSKPIVFTGSQLPIGDLRTDAKENLITSIEIASTHKNGKPVLQEVGLYFEYKLFRANRTSKVNAEHFEAFASMNYPPLVTSGVHLNFNLPFLLSNSSNTAPLILRKDLVEDIVVLKLFPGIGKTVLHTIVNIPNLKGIIIETYGAGNAPNTQWFLDLLSQAIARGIKVINITQCTGGSVIMGHYETSVGLKDIGVIDGKDMTTEAAVAKMMYLLSKKLTKREFSQYFSVSLRGEIS